MEAITFERPRIPNFGAGPCAKPPGWELSHLKNVLMARSHRSAEGVQRIQEVLHLLRLVLNIPENYKVTLVSGSATAAVETLFWCLLGKKKVQVHVWDIFGQRWANDVKKILKIDDCELLELNSKKLPQFELTNFEHDVIFTLNASTSGIIASNVSWINNHRQGLTLCDATSAAFAVPLPWELLDATAFSFQKGLGSEAGIGVIVLSPKAVERLEKHTPIWPIPYLFRLTTDKGQLNEKLFEGFLLNTPSMLLIEDALHALKWAHSIGSQKTLYQRTLKNYNIIKKWLDTVPWIKFLVPSEEYRSPTTVCLEIIAPWFKLLTRDSQWEWIKQFCTLLAEQKIAFDIQNHIAATPALRIWCGPTVEAADLEKLMPWLDWAYHKLKKE
ncbi:MAG: phosphoserine aminotransferase [Caedibacter sp. 38-128]|nr:phosphoserine transaminase [Holosporales bacterium]OJX07048.1 MAG: phosphoserine aminotransferase [Caedibacter sp. 38-128]